MNSTKYTRWFIYLLITVAIVAILWTYNSSGSSQEELAISELAQQIKDGEVAELEVSGDGREVTVRYEDNNRPVVISQISNVSSLEEVLAAYGISESFYGEGKTILIYEKPSKWGSWLSLLSIFLPALLIMGFIYLILRQSQGTNNQALSFGKSKARMFTGDHPTVSFNDVAG